MKKILVVFFSLFLFQVVYTACSCYGDRSAVSKYDTKYDSVSLSALNTLGFRNENIEGPISKYALGLDVYVYTTIEKIAVNNAKYDNTVFGTSYATTPWPVGGAPCNVSPTTVFTKTDPIDHVEFIVIDAITNEKINVTDNFETYLGQKYVTINEQIQSTEDLRSGSYDLTRFDNIPNSAIFVINIYLKSGLVLSDKTQEINFK